MNMLFALIVLFSLPTTLAFAESQTEDVDLLYKKGLEAMAAGNYDEAISYFDQILEIDPNYVEVLNNKGASLGHLGEIEEGIAYFDKTLEIDPNNEIAWNNKGTLLGQLGNMGEAISHYKKALEINPDYEQAKINLKTALENPNYNDVDGYIEIIVRDSQGFLVAYMKPTVFKVIDHPLLLADELKEWRVDETIIRDGQEFQVLKRKLELKIQDEYPSNTIGRFGIGVNEPEQFFVYFSNAHQVPVTNGDQMTMLFTKFRPIE